MHERFQQKSMKGYVDFYKIWKAWFEIVNAWKFSTKKRETLGGFLLNTEV